jgi:hypothetical protein
VIDAKRPVTAPSSLAEAKSYSGDDVRGALYATFLGKCYLCETPVEPGTFSVDHRRPKAEHPEAEFEWDNLFPTCSQFSCNNRRQKHYPVGGLLNPGEGVEQRVIQRIERTVTMSLRSGGNCALIFEAQSSQDLPAKNAAIELDRIHNGTDSTAIHAAGSLRRAIIDHVSAVAHDICDYIQLMTDPAIDASELDKMRSRVARLVSRRAPYAMLVRSYFARIEAIRRLFD